MAAFLRRRRSRSDRPPQMPKRSSWSRAYSRHSTRTSQVVQTRLASRVEPPFSGKKASGSVWAHSARSCQPSSSASVSGRTVASSHRVYLLDRWPGVLATRGPRSWCRPQSRDRHGVNYTRVRALRVNPGSRILLPHGERHARRDVSARARAEVGPVIRASRSSGSGRGRRAEPLRRAPRRRSSCAGGPAARRPRRAPRARATLLREPCSEPAIRLMVSSISVPPRSSHPPRSSVRVPSAPSFTHEHWTWSMAPCSSSRAIACTARSSRARRAGAGDAGEVDGRVVVDERQRHELGEAAGALLDRAQQRRCATQWDGLSTWPYIIVELDADAELVRGGDDLDPRRGRQLALGEHPAHVVVEDLRGGARDRVEPGGLGLDRATRAPTARRGWRR